MRVILFATLTVLVSLFVNGKVFAGQLSNEIFEGTLEQNGCPVPVREPGTGAFEFDDMEEFQRFPLAAMAARHAPPPPQESIHEKYADEIQEAQRALARLLQTNRRVGDKSRFDLDHVDGATALIIDVAEESSGNRNGTVNYDEMKHLMEALGLGNLISRGVWTSTMMDIFNPENEGRPDSRKIMTMSDFRKGLIDTGFYTESGERTSNPVWNY